LRGKVVERWSLTGELCLAIDLQLMGDVGKLFAIGQQTRPTQPFIRSG